MQQDLTLKGGVPRVVLAAVVGWGDFAELVGVRGRGGSGG
jgi:hypothetical protein